MFMIVSYVRRLQNDWWGSPKEKYLTGSDLSERLIYFYYEFDI